MKPSWAQKITVIAIAGGGSGGGGYYAFSSETGFKTGGGGGSAGEMIMHTYNASALPSSVTIQVGAGGPAVGVNTNGNPGGFSRFGPTTGATFRVLEARGGFGGARGIRTLDNDGATTSNTQPTPSSFISTGGGGGGAGVSNPASSWGSIRWCDASDLPYTVNDAIRHSLNSLANPGIPSPVSPTGGGGGTGVSGSNNVGSVYNSPTATAGKGGSILSINSNTGSALDGTPTNRWSAKGHINNSLVQTVNTSTPTSLTNFYQYVSIGLGGRGGNFNNSIAPVAGGNFGGGGGGGGWNKSSAKGGDGVVVVISEA